VKTGAVRAGLSFRQRKSKEKQRKKKRENAINSGFESFELKKAWLAETRGILRKTTQNRFREVGRNCIAKRNTRKTRNGNAN